MINDDPVYVLTVGDRNNTETTLRPAMDDIEPVITVPSEGILSCDETRDFWVSWQDRVISKFPNFDTLNLAHSYNCVNLFKLNSISR